MEKGDEELINDKLVTIGYFSDELEARLARLKLDNAGIESFLADENIFNVNWFYRAMTGGIKLQVSKCDAQKALKALNDETPKPDMVKSVLGDTDLCCPECSSENIEYEEVDRKLAFLSILLVKFPIPLKKRLFKCNTCGHEWKHNSK